MKKSTCIPFLIGLGGSTLGPSPMSGGTANWIVRETDLSHRALSEWPAADAMVADVVVSGLPGNRGAGGVGLAFQEPGDSAVDSTVVDTQTVELQELRRALLDDKAREVSWWLQLIAILLALGGLLGTVLGSLIFFGVREKSKEVKQLQTDIQDAAAEVRKTKNEAESAVAEVQKTKREVRTAATQVSKAKKEVRRASKQVTKAKTTAERAASEVATAKNEVDEAVTEVNTAKERAEEAAKSINELAQRLLEATGQQGIPEGERQQDAG